MLAADSQRRFALSAPLSATATSTVGAPSETDSPQGGSTRWLFQADTDTVTATLGAGGAGSGGNWRERRFGSGADR